MSADVMTDLLRGVAQLLAAQGAGSWSESGTAGAEPRIFLRRTAAADGMSITLTEYQLAADARRSDSITGINLRVRGSALESTASNIAAACYNVLHALGRVTLGTAPNQVMINDMTWESEVMLGPDSNGRAMRSINYYVKHNRAHARLD